MPTAEAEIVTEKVEKVEDNEENILLGRRVKIDGVNWRYNSNMKTVLFLGVDAREQVIHDNAVGSGGRSDTIILFIIDTESESIQMMPISRDTITTVDIYDTKRNFLFSSNMQVTMQYAYVFVASIIYIKSPGPVIYTSTRIGKNGKRFKFYKFRSMYLDADERKASLMSKNRISDGLMFKLDFDPRIIGNEVLPDGTRKTGIGEFIRKTSLDEFPQFFNVLKGDMSLVGTRPPTEDEWNKY